MKTLCYIKVTLLFQKEKDGRWTAECKELGTATFGNSLEEVREFIKEAIELQLNSLERNGQRKRFFKENGITLIRNRCPENVNINVPVDPHIFIQPSFYPIHAYTGTC